MTRSRSFLPDSMRALRILLSFGLLLVGACATTKPHYSQSQDFIAPMDKLASAVNATLHDPYSTNTLSGQQLLVAAMAPKPELKDAFRNQSLLITNHNDKAILLLLNPNDPSIAWLEYASWSNHLPRFHYLSNPPSPAQFTIPLR